ncbi:MAG: outer membrane protein assembly factor BamD [Odoribacter sp.]|nr:outer membrane protein assembly factor BamD [Odoribacter sp.]
MHNYCVFMSVINFFEYFCATLKNMNLKVFIVLIVSLLVSSCGGYEKILKSTDYELKKNKAQEYYDKGLFVKSSELLAQVIPRYRATEEAERLSWMNAKCYYGMKDYLMAGSEFRNFGDMYPYSNNSEEANFMAAMCDYYQSPRAELDQESTRNAINGFNLFLTRFPASTRIGEAKKNIKELEERLVEKSYLSAKLYYEMKQYKAAIVALNNSLKEYPETGYREEMMYLKLTSLFLYAENSVANKQMERYQATLDDYYSFMEEFPKSSYSKEVSSIFQATGKVLKINTEIKANNQ